MLRVCLRPQLLAPASGCLVLLLLTEVPGVLPLLLLLLLLPLLLLVLLLLPLLLLLLVVGCPVSHCSSLVAMLPMRSDRSR